MDSANAEWTPSTLANRHNKVPFLPSLRTHVASIGPRWLPVVLVLGAIAAVAYVHHHVHSIPIAYLYIFPLGAGAILLRKKAIYALAVSCVLLHDYYSPQVIHPRLRILDNLLALLSYLFVIYVIRRYIDQRETLAATIQQQRDDLLQEIGLAAQVQRMFLPTSKPAMAGLEIAGVMQPAEGVGGDYYDYILVNPHTIQIVVADVSGKGVSAALLMSATAAALQSETNHERNILEMVNRLNAGIHSVSDGEHYVTLLLAEIDTQKRTVRYVNCGHNPALLFQADKGRVIRMESSCPPVGMFSEESCELAFSGLCSGDVLVLYTDGVTEAQNRLGEEFGTQRLSDFVRRGSSGSAEELMNGIVHSAAEFSGEVGFSDDVTVVVVKCVFDAPRTVADSRVTGGN